MSSTDTTDKSNDKTLISSTNIQQRKSEGCCISDLSIEKIIVFQNKAEITRSMRYEIFAGQRLEINLEQLPSSIDKESIRVEIVNKIAGIDDVTFQTKVLSTNTACHERLNEISTEIKKLSRQLESLESTLNRYNRQKSVLETFTTTLMQKQSDVNEENKEQQLDPYDPKHLDTVRSFFQLYDDKAEKFDESIHETQHSIEDINRKINFLNSEKSDIELRIDEQLYREVSILLDCYEDGEMEIKVSYITRNCSWRPSYDLRVSNDNGTMQIYYYAMVKQSSSEDWYQPNKFVVSTAEPSSGGTLPDMGIQKIQYRSHLEPIIENHSPPPLSPVLSTTSLRKSPSKFSSFRKTKSPSMLIMNNLNNFTSLKATDENDIVSHMETNKNSPNDTPIITKSTENASVTYEVCRSPSLITCDNKEVKVMIGTLTLDPIYTHVTVPRLSFSAYQRATCKNNSNFTLLAGPAYIYVNSCFIGKSQLSTIYSCEDFICNLGVDKDIQIKYLPLIKFKNPDSKYVNVTYKQEIEISNNHSKPIRITVIDQLPVSNDGDKIKIQMLEPSLKADKHSQIRKSDSGQLEWDNDLGANCVKKLTIRFSVEHPADREIEIINIKQ